MSESPLNSAIRLFEATEANLVKAEKVLDEINAAIPSGIVFGDNPEYENNCRMFNLLLDALPKIDRWKPEIRLLELDEIAQNRLDANDIGEIEFTISIERQINEPAKLLREYRYRFNQKRRELIRDSITKLISAVDTNLHVIGQQIESEDNSNKVVTNDEFEKLKQNIAQIATLLGSSVIEPPRWSDLQSRIHLATYRNLRGIIEHDWPSVKAGLRNSMYGEKEPIPVDIDDLNMLVTAKPQGPVATKLKWESLPDEEFERLVFVLISGEKGYENPEWLMKTNAPDRGRDLSVYRVCTDALGGTLRQRVIIQCKHWQTKSISIADIGMLKEQMKLWEPPRVDVHIIATSGRFTSDAVNAVEKHNQSDNALRIEMWPESHLERLLASRPAIIAEFGLR